MSRTASLIAAVERFNRCHHEWSDNQSSPEYPPASYWNELELLLDTFADCDNMPHDCYGLQSAVKELGEQLDEYDNSGAAQPSDSFWSAREGLEAALKRQNRAKELPPLETMKQLDDEKVPHEQIARMYGLTDDQGKGKAHLVAKELAMPGSVIGPDWIDPRLKEFGVGAAVRPGHEDDASPGKPCPESAEDLWLQKVSVHQAAKMLGRSEHEIADEWRKFEKQYAKHGHEARIRDSEEKIEQLDGAAPEAPEVKGRKSEVVKGGGRSGKRRRRQGPDADVMATTDADQPDTVTTGDEMLSQQSDDYLRQLCTERGIGFTARTTREGLLAKLQEPVVVQ